MPRVARKQMRARTEYGEWHRYHLRTGHAFFVEDLKTEADERECWEALKDEVMAEWVQENPGTRPWAWWKYEEPERRRRIDGKPHPFDNPERQRFVARWMAEYPEVASREAHKLYYGLPGCLIPYDSETAPLDEDGYVMCDDFSAEYESSEDYLQRLGLLSKSEQAALEKAGEHLASTGASARVDE